MKGLVPVLSLILINQAAFSHPIPDIPVRASFASDGTVTIQVEVDPRCFAPDPLNEPYLLIANLQRMDEEEKAKLFAQTKRFIQQNIEFRAIPGGPFQPALAIRFTSFAKEELTASSPAQTPVVITGECRVDASHWKEYQIKSMKGMPFSVQFINEVDGKEQSLNVLFPGEESYKLDLRDWSKRANDQ